MPSQLTVTNGRTGPGVSVAGLVLTGVKDFNVNMARQMLFVNSDQGPKEFDINATTTLTCTITAGANCTLVINQ